MIKLSKTQELAMSRLTNEYQSSYDIDVTRTTLDSLVNKGLAEIKYNRGSHFYPRRSIVYRLKQEGKV